MELGVELIDVLEKLVPKDDSGEKLELKEVDEVLVSIEERLVAKEELEYSIQVKQGVIAVWRQDWLYEAQISFPN